MTWQFQYDAPIDTFWVGVRDGAFQVAREQITVTIN